MPAVSVERRVCPPDFTLITDWPIIAQAAHAAEEAGNEIGDPLTLCLAGFVADGVSVRSSTICAVSSDSSRPTAAIVNE